MSFSYRIEQLTGGMVRNLAITQRQQQKTTTALSSGFKINSAGDDAAGLQISQNLEAQIRGEKKAQENIQTMMNLLNSTDSLVSNVRDQFSRIRDLVVASMNDTNGTEQLAAMKTEIDQRISSAIQMGRGFQFNGVNYFNEELTLSAASPPPRFTGQIGSDSNVNNQMQFTVMGSGYQLSQVNSDLFNLQASDAVFSTARAKGIVSVATLASLGFAFSFGIEGAIIANDPPNGTKNVLESWLRVGTDNQQQNALTFVDKMLNVFNNDLLVNIGSYTNRLEMAARNSEVKVENQMAAQARITNTDYATASVEAVRQNILQQSTMSLMNQAKISHRSVINLIQQSGQVL